MGCLSNCPPCFLLDTPAESPYHATHSGIRQGTNWVLTRGERLGQERMVRAGAFLTIWLLYSDGFGHDPELPNQLATSRGVEFTLPGLFQPQVEYSPVDDVEATIVAFLHSDCPASETEYETLNKLTKAKGMRVIAVARGDLLPLRKSDGQHRFLFPVGIDTTGAVFDAWGVDAYPTVFLLARGGKVESIELGSGSVALTVQQAFSSGSGSPPRTE